MTVTGRGRHTSKIKTKINFEYYNYLSILYYRESDFKAKYVIEEKLFFSLLLSSFLFRRHKVHCIDSYNAL